MRTDGVNAEKLLLLDARGKARAGLGLDNNGEVGLMSREGSRALAFSRRSVYVKLFD